MQPSAHAKRLWRQWERFTRSGVKFNQKSLSPVQLLIAWACILILLYALLWFSRNDEDDDSSVYKKSENELDFWTDRHLIFCVSPGRTGSLYLRNVLDVAENVIAEHEPEPKMTGEYLEDVILNGKRRETLSSRANLKLDAIKDTLQGTAPDIAYAETSHMFIKTFADAILETLGNRVQVSVILLHRPVIDTVWSQVRLGWFSESHSGRNVWYYDPNDVHESERQNSFQTNSSRRIDTIIAYDADVIQRGIELQQEINRRHEEGEWKQVKLFETQLKDISDANDKKIIQFLSQLGLKADAQKLKLLNKQDQNARDEKKRDRALDKDLKFVEKRLRHLSNELPVLRKLLSR